MTRYFKDHGDAGVGDVLAFIESSVKAGDDAAVDAACLPVLTRRAGCQPERQGEAEGCFVFRALLPARPRCGCAERALAALLLLALLPVCMAVGAVIFLFEGAPVLFLQERYGRGGRPFIFFKFRTMMRRSERLHAKLQQKMGQQGRLFKLERDPRVTRTGAFLRRTFLDELPQLANVVRGDMCFVGPRPLPASDQGHYTHAYHELRLAGMPGITGLWQVAGRNARSFDEMCLLDYYYLSNRSFALNARILLRTVGLVLKQTSVCGEAQGRGQEAGKAEGCGGDGG